MANQSFVVNIAGFEALRTSDKVQADLERRAGAVVEACDSENEGDYVARPSPGSTRGRAVGITATQEARVDNGLHNTLIRAMPAARR